jgi:hypothetical protein
MTCNRPRRMCPEPRTVDPSIVIEAFVALLVVENAHFHARIMNCLIHLS